MTGFDRLEGAAAIADSVRCRAVSTTEVIERALERIGARDGPINACVRVLACAGVLLFGMVVDVARYPRDRVA
jgi:Asp-tRNA(Asn)/Glu-tRNA(Gln) amidotransferase A subunit family amidase